MGPTTSYDEGQIRSRCLRLHAKTFSHEVQTPRWRLNAGWWLAAVLVGLAGGGWPLHGAAPVGRVIAWGDNTFGQTNVPGAALEAVAVAAGVDHAMTLKRDGTVECWGSVTSAPPWLSNVVAIAAGTGHSLALRDDGSVVAWGNNARGQTNVPAALGPVQAIAAGAGCSFAVTTQGVVVVWGLGGTMFAPTEVPAWLSNATGISIGDRTGLALQSDLTVTNWGRYSEPVPAGLTNITAISAGFRHFLALTDEGAALGWGASTVGVETVPAGLSNLVAVAAGRYHSLVLKADGTVVAWGGSQYGATNVPAGLERVFAIAAGYTFSLALVAPLSGPPQIIQPPRDVAVWAGGSAVFSVGAVSQEAVNYQWFVNDTPVATAENSSLELAQVQWPHEGDYRVVVSNPFGAVTSTVARLFVYVPRQPVRIAEWPVAGGLSNIANLAVVGNLACLVDRYTGLHLLDIRDPAAPQEVGNLNFNSGGNTHGVTVQGHLAYVSDGSAGVRVVDLSDPAAPVEIGRTPPFDLAVGLQIVGPYAYVADFSGWVRVVDLRDPAQPTVVTSVATAGGGDGLHVDGDYLYVPMRHRGLAIFNLSIPTNPQPLVTYSNTIYAPYFGVATRDDRAYLAVLQGHLEVLDLSQPQTPRFVTNLAGFTAPRRVQIADRLLFVADREAGIGVVDLALPDQPVLVGQADTRGLANATDVAGNLVFVADSEGGLAVFQLEQTAPQPPRVIWTSPSHTIEEDRRLVLAVNVSGNPPLWYQWEKDGVALPHATNAFLVLPATALTDMGDYGVTVTNNHGATTTDPLRLEVVVSASRPRLALARAGADLQLDCRLRLAEGTVQIYGANSVSALGTNGTLIHECPIPASRRFQMSLADWSGREQQFYQLVETPAGPANPPAVP